MQYNDCKILIGKKIDTYSKAFLLGKYLSILLLKFSSKLVYAYNKKSHNLVPINVEKILCKYLCKKCLKTVLVISMLSVGTCPHTGLEIFF